MSRSTQEVICHFPLLVAHVAGCGVVADPFYILVWDRDHWYYVTDLIPGKSVRRFASVFSLARYRVATRSTETGGFVFNPT